jgi:hypothetical protein
MTLCATCKSVDFRTLIITCLLQCQDRQEAIREGHDESLQPERTFRVKHHNDIFEIKKSSTNCNLCKFIFQAFEKRKVADVEEARGLPIVFRAFSNKIEACYDAGEELINLSGLDLYMNEVDGENYFGKIL